MCRWKNKKEGGFERIGSEYDFRIVIAKFTVNHEKLQKKNLEAK